MSALWCALEGGGPERKAGGSCVGDSEPGAIRPGLHSPSRVPMVGGSPGALAGSAGPGTARWPASGMQPFPPLALGGMGGGALSCLIRLAT